MRRQQTVRLRFAAAVGSPELPDVNVLLQQPELEAGMGGQLPMIKGKTGLYHFAGWLWTHRRRSQRHVAKAMTLEPHY
jgi:hypothetical protein